MVSVNVKVLKNCRLRLKCSLRYADHLEMIVFVTFGREWESFLVQGLYHLEVSNKNLLKIRY